ncbi:MAG: sigma-70 family RNA polymerase sigma factor [Lysobacterales bacterium]|jgi:RNA polymerase sigma-70 factor (ECF subfamily)
MESSSETSPEHASDESRWAALMVNAQAGHEADYRRLLGELADVVTAFLRSRFGNGHFIEDCVQETLIAIHEARHTYDSRRPFRPWLFAIVRHKAIDTLRKRSTRQRLTASYRDTQEVLAQSGRASEAEAEITGSRLLESLPETHRQALVLTKLVGLSVAEAAAKLEISPSLVKVRVHRAIRKLRRDMELEIP